MSFQPTSGGWSWMVAAGVARTRQPETVREDLAEGMDQAGVQVEGAELDRIAQEIHDEGSSEAPRVE